VAVPILQGQAFVMGEQKELFPDRFRRDPYHAQYVVTPDDRRFIFVELKREGQGDAVAAPAPPVLAQHWLAEMDLRPNAAR
jgi:hypothetical protein